MILRDYQKLGLNKIRQAYASGFKRPILTSPTGSGKTVIAGEVISGALAKRNRVMFLAGSKELVDQCSKRVDELGIDHGIIQGKHWRQNYGLPVQVGSIQTVVNRTGFEDPNIIIVDECHHAIASQWQKCLDRWPNKMFLGLTATPYRLDNKGLGHIFDTIIPLTTTQKLVAAGYLVPPIVYAPSQPDLTDMGSGREYNKTKLNIECDRPELIGDILLHWLELAAGRQTIAFAVSIAHSKHIRDQFLAAGIKAAHVDGKMGIRERSEIFERYAAGDIMVLCNVGVATEGYDNPATSCIILARPTKSRCLWRQMIGRGLRPCLEIGKLDCIVLDHANLTRTHGFLKDPDHYDLTGLNTRRHREGAVGGFSVRVCPECFSCLRGGVFECPYCDYIFPRASIDIPRTRAGKLTIAPGEAYVKNASDDKKRETWNFLVNKAKDNGYKKGWIFIQYKIRFAVMPPSDWMQELA